MIIPLEVHIKDSIKIQKRLLHISKAEKSVVVKRALRHKSPILIIPYYVGTRDEDLMKKMIENCSKNKIVSINNINQLYNIT